MIRTELRFGRDAELTHRVDVLARLVRSAPRYTDALRWWAGFELRREPRVPDEVEELGDRDALLLDLQPASTVTRRDGYLVSAITGSTFRVAAAVALVHEPVPDGEQRAALRAGTVPLSQLLPGCQRAVHYAHRSAGDPLDDQPALRSRVTLLRAGRPVALVLETVYWRLVTHRAPGQLPHYIQPAQNNSTAW